MKNKRTLAIFALASLAWPAVAHPYHPYTEGRPVVWVAAADQADPYTVGPLKLGMPQADALKALAAFGPAETTTEPVLEQASGLYVKQWLYPEKGFGVTLGSESKDDGYSVRTILLEEPCDWEAVLGLKIGMPEADAKARIKGLMREGVSVFDVGHEEDTGVLFEDTYIVLSVRAIDGVVKHLYLGPGPE